MPGTTCDTFTELWRSFRQFNERLTLRLHLAVARSAYSRWSIDPFAGLMVTIMRVPMRYSSCRQEARRRVTILARTNELPCRLEAVILLETWPS
jgi:uncharacterized protein YcgI (DUF1989 family)